MAGKIWYPNNASELVDYRLMRKWMEQVGGLLGGDGTLDTTNFDNNLSSADTTVQKALDTLDDFSVSSSGVSTDTTNFDNNLSAADTTTQKALDTLDNLVVGGGDTYTDRGDPSAYDVNFTTDGAWHDWDISSIVGANEATVDAIVNILDDVATSYITIREKGNSNNYNIGWARTMVANVENNVLVKFHTNSSGVVEYKTTNTTWNVCRAVITGWLK